MQKSVGELCLDGAMYGDTFDDLFAFTKGNGGMTRLSSGPELEKNMLYTDYNYPLLIQKYEIKSAQYWNNLNAENTAALHLMQSWIQNEHIRFDLLTGNDLHESLVILRYLRSNQFKITETKEHIVRSVQWRESVDINALAKRLPNDILGYSMEELMNVFPHWQSGFDKSGRPVLYKQYGKFDAGALKQLSGGTFDNLILYHAWEQEACGRLCLAQSIKHKAIVETVTIVLDLLDMKITQVGNNFITLVSALSEIDGKHYPETVGRIFVINATSSFAVAWRIVRPWVVPATASKMKILGGPQEYIPVLREFIGEKNLPSNYGGTLPALSPKVHPYSEIMKEVRFQVDVPELVAKTAESII